MIDIIKEIYAAQLVFDGHILICILLSEDKRKILLDEGWDIGVQIIVALLQQCRDLLL